MLRETHGVFISDDPKVDRHNKGKLWRLRKYTNQEQSGKNRDFPLECPHIATGFPEGLAVKTVLSLVQAYVVDQLIL